MSSVTSRRRIVAVDAKIVKILRAEGEAGSAIAAAQGEAEAAKIIESSKEAVLLKLTVLERTLAAQAKVAAASNLPKNILPSGSPLLMGLDTRE